MERLTMAPPPAAAESLTTAATLFGMGTNTTTSLNSSLDFHFVVDGNIQTLSTHSSPGKGPIQGLLYVPSLDSNDPCNDILAPYVPSNVTRKDDVEPIGHHSIALAPWVSVDCTQSLLEASRIDKPDALVFYLPHTSSTKMPPPSDDPAWVLGDNSQWMDQNEYPVYAIPASAGATLMQRLSWYSGDTTIAPNSSLDNNGSGHDGSVSHASENVRLFTFIDLAKDDKKMPSLWGFVLAILGTILVLSILILILYQIVQKKRRERLQRRIETGDVDLEFLGLNQMKVPREVLDQLPKYTYPEPNTPPEAVLNSSTGAQAQNTKFYTDGRGAITTIREESEEETAVEAAATAANTDDDESHVRCPRPAVTPTPTTTPTTTSAIAPDQGIPSTTSEYRFSYSQTTCAICLDDYEPGLSIVREMPCGHIFDVDCIDTFLTQGSSLCPLCKKSVLPAGSYPIPVTNVMVQRDYIQRRSH